MSTFLKFTPEKFNALYKEGFGVASFASSKQACLQMIGEPQAHMYETYLGILPEEKIMKLINSNPGHITVKRCTEYPHLFLVVVTTNDWSKLNDIVSDLKSNQSANLLR